MSRSIDHTVVGTVGRRTTSRLITAVDVDQAAPLPRVTVLLGPGAERTPDGARGRSWSEVLANVSTDEVIVVPSHDARLRQAASLTGARLVTFGFRDDADVVAQRVVTGLHGTEVEIEVNGERLTVRLQLVGDHFAEDALAAFAAASAVGVEARRIADSFETVQSAESTMAVGTTPGGVVVIDDSVSMAPESVVSALKTLAIIGADGRRTVAVLDQLDLPEGITTDASRDAHDRIGRIVVRLGLNLIVVIGAAARHIHNAAGLEGSWNGESVLVDSIGEAYDRVRGDLEPGDAVLIKLGDATAAAALTARLGVTRA